jgi:hypothetical protein
MLWVTGRSLKVVRGIQYGERSFCSGQSPLSALPFEVLPSVQAGPYSLSWQLLNLSIVGLLFALDCALE